MSELENKLKLLPDHSGVYVMLNSENAVIYVGKAKNLKNRVSQYFRSGIKPEKVSAMVSNVADFYYILTDTENEAFTLENNLIKKYKPRYNILLKDDKTYPYLKINLKNRFPYFEITRRIKKDGAKYYGPFMNGISVGEMLDLINGVYKLRSCKFVLDGKKRKECLNYHIKTCLAPCADYCTEQEYVQAVKKAISFLEGETDETEKILTEKMNNFALNEQFELALDAREKLKMLKKIDGKKLVSLNRFINADVVSLASNGIFSAVGVLITRSGKMLGGNCYSLDGTGIDGEEYLSSFLKQYYVKGKEFPDEIIVNIPLSEAKDLEEYFYLLGGRKVKINYAVKGDKKALCDMALANAKDYLERYIGKIKHKQDMTVLACEHLKEILNLKKTPLTMECYDISHTSGTEKVGSMVVFKNGEADKTSYRKFKIKTVVGNDDFACLQEVLKRRLQKIVLKDEHFPKPDLIIIDGGKGQLSSVKEIFDEYGCDIDLISLAKKEELVYTIYSNQPVVLNHRDYSLRLLQRIRDEAHRFAITFHRSLRDKRTLESEIAEIQGVGEKRAKELIKVIGSVKLVSQAEKRQLMMVDGIGEKTADAIIKHFALKNE